MSYDIFRIQTFQFQPYRNKGKKFSQFLIYQFSSLYYIFCRVGGNTDTYGTLPVDMHDVAGRIHISFFNDGNIAQFHLSARSGNHLVPDVIDGSIGSVGYNAQLLFTGIDFTCIDNLVLRL